MKEGNIYKTNSYGNIKVVKYERATKVTIQFLDTGFIRETQASNIRAGALRDPTRKTILGVACLGFGEFNTKSLGYQTWRNMLARCYDEDHKHYKNYGGIGVYVSEDWLDFQNYAQFYKDNYKTDYPLDKDLLVSGNLVYSEDTCVFLPRTINNAIRIGLGVSKYNGGFVSRLQKQGKSKYLGTFQTEEQARLEYLKEKNLYLKELSEYYYTKGQLCEKAYQALQNLT